MNKPLGNQPSPSEILKKFEEQIKTYNFTDEKVMSLSEDLGKELTFNQRGRGEREGKEVTRTQIRKFYNLVRVAQTSAGSPEVSAETVKVKLRTLKAQVAYAVARSTISPEFKKFFDASLDKMISSGDLKVSLNQFATFFESLYAYFYYYSEGKR